MLLGVLSDRQLSAGRLAVAVSLPPGMVYKHLHKLVEIGMLSVITKHASMRFSIASPQPALKLMKSKLLWPRKSLPTCHLTSALKRKTARQINSRKCPAYWRGERRTQMNLVNRTHAADILANSSPARRAHARGNARFRPRLFPQAAQFRRRSCLGIPTGGKLLQAVKASNSS